MLYLPCAAGRLTAEPRHPCGVPVRAPNGGADRRTSSGGGSAAGSPSQGIRRQMLPTLTQKPLSFPADSYEFFSFFILAEKRAFFPFFHPNAGFSAWFFLARGARIIRGAYAGARTCAIRRICPVLLPPGAKNFFGFDSFEFTPRSLTGCGKWTTMESGNLGCCTHPAGKEESP